MLKADSFDAGRRELAGPRASFLATVMKTEKRERDKHKNDEPNAWCQPEQGQSDASIGKTAADLGHCNEDRPPNSWKVEVQTTTTTTTTKNAAYINAYLQNNLQKYRLKESACTCVRAIATSTKSFPALGVVAEIH